MRTLLISGSDTGVGKTRVTGELARRLVGPGVRVQVVKPVESGADPDGAPGDAEQAAVRAGLPPDAAHTLRRYAAPINPLDAAAAQGETLDWTALLRDYHALPDCDWRLVEGAGGLAVPLAGDGRDWADFAAEIGAEAVVLVVADRLGAINQARLALAHARARGLRAGIWLNAAQAGPDPEAAASTRRTLSALGVPVWGKSGYGDDAVTRCAPELFAEGAENFSEEMAPRAPSGPVAERCASGLVEREKDGLRRRLRVFAGEPGLLNLAGNDYLALAGDPVLAEACARAAWTRGTSASASALITGWHPAHAEAVETLCRWHGFATGLVWSSGHAANVGVLGALTRPGDLVLADHLIHHSMVTGILRGGARLRRYPHLDLDALERELVAAEPGRPVFVVTESVFSMDGDYPDLRRIAELKRRHGFCWILDEAHALGWYGPDGNGLAAEQGVTEAVDVFVGTFGKALASGGAYTLFHHELWRDALINQAGEFIYSTALPPTCAAVAVAAAGRARLLAREGQAGWRATSRALRSRLRAAGWDAPDGDAPIVPVRVGGAERAVALAAWLREAGIIVAAVRPPTVPAGTSRLRLSLRRTFDMDAADRLLAALGTAGEG